MNEDAPANVPAAAAPVVSRPAGTAEERRTLLRAVVATGAAAGLPLTAHATGRPYCKHWTGGSNNYHPSASSVGSIIGSVTAGAPCIKGHKRTHYVGGGWGTGWHNGSTYTSQQITWARCGDANTPTAQKIKFFQAFGFSSPNTAAEDVFCHTVLASDSEQAIWLVALLNANKVANFSYGPDDILKLYRGIHPTAGNLYTGTSGALKLGARNLFSEYLSQEA